MLVTEAIYKSHLYIEGSSLTLEDEGGTNMLSRNVSIQLPTCQYTATNMPVYSYQHVSIQLQTCQYTATNMLVYSYQHTLRSIPGDRQPQHNGMAASHLESLLFLIRNCLAQATY
jgi:hypothetical protein